LVVVSERGTGRAKTRGVRGESRIGDREGKGGQKAEMKEAIKGPWKNRLAVPAEHLVLLLLPPTAFLLPPIH
jgi:hypothetical protein